MQAKVGSGMDEVKPSQEDVTRVDITSVCRDGYSGDCLCCGRDGSECEKYSVAGTQAADGTMQIS